MNFILIKKELKLKKMRNEFCNVGSYFYFNNTVLKSIIYRDIIDSEMTEIRIEPVYIFELINLNKTISKCETQKSCRNCVYLTIILF